MKLKEKTGVLGSVAEKSDAELVGLARCGNKEAFGGLIERYQPIVRRIAARMVGSEEIVGELVQEAMLQAYLSLDQLHEDSRFKNWLYGIVLNLCRGHLRDQKIASFSLDALAGGSYFETDLFSHLNTTPDPQIIAEERELQNLVLAAVNQLSPENRAATLLFYYRQLSLREVAALLSISVGAVKGRLHKSRNQLREYLRQAYPEIEQPLVAPNPRRKAMVKVTILDLIQPALEIETGRKYIVVLLYDEARKRLLPIWVGEAEGEAIAVGLHQLEVKRPLTFSFMARLLEASGATLEEVRIEALQNEIFYAVAKIRTGDKVQEIDARPSDALALAIQTGSPLYAAEEVLQKAGVPVPAGALQNPPTEDVLIKLSPNTPEIELPSFGKGLEELIKKLEAQMQKIPLTQPILPAEAREKS